jgi:hypothetical protein
MQSLPLSMSKVGPVQAEQSPPGGQARPTPQRPKVRADCQDGPRPCPHIGCDWHACWLNKEVLEVIENDRIHPVMAASIAMKMEQTCILDMAEEPQGEREIAAVLGVSHQRIGQMVKAALGKLGQKKAVKHSQHELDSPAAPNGWQWSGRHIPEPDY